MDEKQIEKIILNFFYSLSKPSHPRQVNILLSENKNINKDKLLKVLDKLADQYLIRKSSMTNMREITSFGIAYAEKNNLFPEEDLIFHQSLRFRILSILAELYESEGRLTQLNQSEICEKLGIDKRSEFYPNIDVLKAFDFVKSHSIGNYRITESGLKQFKIWKQQKFFNDEFERISKLSPQARGRELEKLIAEVLESAGWHQERNVTTSYEQIDVVISYIREFYLIECKWEKAPIEADVIDKLFGKLSRRAGTNGILMSMSGFTKGCADCVKDHMSRKLILLFGKEDIEQIISNPSSFETLLNEKHEELVKRRKAIWK